MASQATSRATPPNLTLKLANFSAPLLSEHAEAALRAGLGTQSGLHAMQTTLCIPIGINTPLSAFLLPNVSFLPDPACDATSWQTWRDLAPDHQAAGAAIAMQVLSDPSLDAAVNSREMLEILDPLLEESLELEILDLIFLSHTTLLMRRDFIDFPLSMDTLEELDDDKLERCMIFLPRRPAKSAHDRRSRLRDVAADEALLCRLTRFRHPDGDVEVTPRLPY